MAIRRAPAMMKGENDYVFHLTLRDHPSRDGRAEYDVRLTRGKREVWSGRVGSAVGGPTVLRGRTYERVAWDSTDAYDVIAQSAASFAADELKDDDLWFVGGYTDENDKEANPWRARVPGFKRS